MASTVKIVALGLVVCFWPFALVLAAMVGQQGRRLVARVLRRAL